MRAEGRALGPGNCAVRVRSVLDEVLRKSGWCQSFERSSATVARSRRGSPRSASEERNTDLVVALAPAVRLADLDLAQRLPTPRVGQADHVEGGVALLGVERRKGENGRRLAAQPLVRRPKLQTPHFIEASTECSASTGWTAEGGRRADDAPPSHNLVSRTARHTGCRPASTQSHRRGTSRAPCRAYCAASRGVAEQTRTGK